MFSVESPLVTFNIFRVLLVKCSVENLVLFVPCEPYRRPTAYQQNIGAEVFLICRYVLGADGADGGEGEWRGVGVKPMLPEHAFPGIICVDSICGAARWVAGSVGYIPGILIFLILAQRHQYSCYIMFVFISFSSFVSGCRRASIRGSFNSWRS